MVKTQHAKKKKKSKTKRKKKNNKKNNRSISKNIPLASINVKERESSTYA